MSTQRDALWNRLCEMAVRLLVVEFEMGDDYDSNFAGIMAKTLARAAEELVEAYPDLDEDAAFVLETVNDTKEGYIEPDAAVNRLMASKGVRR